MTQRQEQLARLVDAGRERILETERWLWEHPQTGFTEWEAEGWLEEQYRALGYTLVTAGDIPGFYTDIDTGRPGPTLCILGELDALEMPNHPQAIHGMAHACGHHAQGAALLGVAMALKQPGALEGLSGRIRLMMTPAEELIQLPFREELRKKGVIHALTGKVELMHRGLFDGVDLAFMVHGTSEGEEHWFSGIGGYNGCIAKIIRYKGRAAHAGGAPERGINAQYAAMLGLQACNDLRETFQEKDAIRFHPIMTGVTSAVNIIPAEMKLESFVRGRTLDGIIRENKKINRALAGGALALGAGVELTDRPGYAPECHDSTFLALTQQVCTDLAGPERTAFYPQMWSTGSSDFGDVTTVMPGVQFYAAGAVGNPHGDDYLPADPVRLCVNSAKAQVLLADALLREKAAAAWGIVKNYQPRFSSISEYFREMDKLILDKDAVTYDSDGSARIDYQN